MDSLKIYERLKNAKFDDAKAKELASILSLFGEASPTSKQDLRETELRLVREIKGLETKMMEIDSKHSIAIKELDSKLSKDIKELDFKLSKEMKELDSKLSKEMKDMELRLSKEIEGIRSSTVRWVAGLMLANTGLMVSMIKFL